MQTKWLFNFSGFNLKPTDIFFLLSLMPAGHADVTPWANRWANNSVIDGLWNLMRIQALAGYLCGPLSSKQGFVGRGRDRQSSFHQTAGDARVSVEAQRGCGQSFSSIVIISVLVWLDRLKTKGEKKHKNKMKMRRWRWRDLGSSGSPSSASSAASVFSACVCSAAAAAAARGQSNRLTLTPPCALMHAFGIYASKPVGGALAPVWLGSWWWIKAQHT